MAANPAHAEYSKKAKREGDFARRCFFTVFLWVVLILLSLIFVVFIAASNAGAAVYAAAVCGICVLAVILPTRVNFTLEYDYIISFGVMTVSSIYGRRKRKVIIEADIRKMTLIAPYTEASEKRIKRAGAVKRYNVLSDAASEEAFYALFTDENHRSSVIIFDADEKFFTCARFYNPTALLRT